MRALRRGFLETDRWKVVDREVMNVSLQELGIAASEVAKDSEAPLILGRLWGARGLLVGGLRSDGERKTAWAEVIDSETRKVLASEESESADFSGLAGPLVEELVAELEEDFVLQGRITQVLDGTVLLNIGEDHGVQVGQRFEVYPKEFNERAAHQVLGLKAIGELEVVQVAESECACSVIRSDVEFTENMRAQEQ
jgi:hypothetical protein